MSKPYSEYTPEDIYNMRTEIFQLKREREKLNKKLDIALRNNANITHLKLDKVDLQGELDQLKAENDSLKSELMQTYCYLEADKETIDQLKQECEELKYKLERIRQIEELALDEILTVGRKNATAQILQIIEE